MSMQTESIVVSTVVERVATIKIVRVVDFEKIAHENGGAVSLEALKTAGDFVVVIEPTGKGAEPERIDCEHEAAATSFVDGFKRCADLKRKGPRKPKTPAEAAKAKQAREAKKAAKPKAAKPNG